MFSFQKSLPLRGLTLLSVVSLLVLLAVQVVWLQHIYHITYSQFIAEIDLAFEHAYQKEQTYRVPVRDIVPQGNLTIQSCGKEEIRIIRHCPHPDTIVYDNIYGQSVESIISRAFHELRESITPLNLYCLSDLFAGELYEKKISLSYVIERFHVATGAIIESTETTETPPSATRSTQVLTTNISETEGLRAKLYFSPAPVLQRMSGVLTMSAGVLLIIVVCMGLQVFSAFRRRRALAPRTAPAPEPLHEFKLGQYLFDADKNELQGFGTTVTLAKKENALLQELCLHAGNVVGRDRLLEKYWEGTGFIYSRSLDTYIARLRKLLSDDPSVQIVTIKSVGYKLTIATPQ
jgi:hypothetical protein